MNKEQFEKEIEMCRELSKDKICKWGECKDCGVVPLLIKLHEGRIIEDKEEILKIKKMKGINL